MTVHGNRSATPFAVMMVKDVVCGMQIDEKGAAGKSEHQGKTYFFCSPGCKAKFDQNPAKYASEVEPGGAACRRRDTTRVLLAGVGGRAAGNVAPVRLVVPRARRIHHGGTEGTEDHHGGTEHTEADRDRWRVLRAVRLDGLDVEYWHAGTASEA